MCILVTEPYHASRLFEIVQQLLLEDIRLTNSVLSLQKKLAEGSSANNIAAFVSDVLENPVLLLSADGTPLASNGFSSGDSALITACRPNAFLMRLQNSPFMLLEPGDGLDPLPRRMLYMRICQEQTDILLFTAEQENSFADTDAASRLAALHEAFASIPWKQEHLCPQLQLQNLLFRLLQKQAFQ